MKIEEVVKNENPLQRDTGEGSWRQGKEKSELKLREFFSVPSGSGRRIRVLARVRDVPQRLNRNSHDSIKIALLAAVVLISAAVHSACANENPAGNTTGNAVVKLAVPLFSPRFSGVAVAEVNGEPITVEEFGEALGTIHQGRNEEAKAGKDYGRVLKRLVSGKLINQEARAMGMHELFEVKDSLDAYRKTTLREILRTQLTRDVQADEAEVEKAYRESIKEFTVRSLMFAQEDDAKAMAAAVASGKEFSELAGQAIAGKTARGSGQPETLTAGQLGPAVAQALAAMQPGMTSPVLSIRPGFVLFKLEDVRETEKPEAREQARRKVLAGKQVEALVAYNKILSRQYLTFNKKLIERLDYGSREPGIEKLLKDKRVLVKVKGEAPITVADLTKALEEKLYHGSERAAKNKINGKKMDAFEELLGKRLLLAEARKRGIDKTEEYARKVKEREDQLLFGMFVQRVIVPDVKPSIDEVKAYYEQHRGRYALSPRVRLETLLFSQRQEAEEAMSQVRKGAELRWVRENGPVLPAENSSVAEFENSVVGLDELPEDWKTKLAGAKAGDTAVVEGPDGSWRLLSVQEALPGEIMPFEKVADLATKSVYDEKIQKALDTWTDRLTQTADLRYYMAPDEK
jgi:parvulin-like peptidyl-prolyl isomerase